MWPTSNIDSKKGTIVEFSHKRVDDRSVHVGSGIHVASMRKCRVLLMAVLRGVPRNNRDRYAYTGDERTKLDICRKLAWAGGPSSTCSAIPSFFALSLLKSHQNMYYVCPCQRLPRPWESPTTLSTGESREIIVSRNLPGHRRS